MSKRLFLFGSAIFLVSACSFYNINSEETTENFYTAKKSVDEVAYLEQVTQPHEVIGTVTTTTEKTHTREEVIEKMKREAAVIGGDAITDIQPVKKCNACIRVKYKATVVVFKK
jgi:hypothetical protein